MKRAFIASLLLLPLTVNAQNYFGIGAGITKADVDSIAPTRDAILANVGMFCGGNFGFGTVQCTDSVDDSGTGFKIFGGNRFNQNLAVEFFYADLGDFSADATATDSIGTLLRLRGEAEATAFGASLLVIYPLGSAEIFGKGGIARWSIDATATASDDFITITASESDDGFDPLFGLGVQFGFDSFLIRAEYEKFLNVGNENTTGESDVDFISASVIFRF